jgi:glutathione S-transferase
MYQLYYMAGSCSMAVHVALIESGAKFELLNISEHADAFKKANPAGQVPTLMVDGKVLVEGAAILTYVCEQEKLALLPASGWDRAKAMQWLAFANSTLHPRYSALFGQMRFLGEDAPNTPLYKMIVGKIQDAWNMVEVELADKEYMVGNSATIGDVLLTVIANWTPRVANDVVFGPKTKAYFARITSRPSYQQALKAEQVEYKVAA